MKLFILDSNKKLIAGLQEYFALNDDFDIVGTANNGIDGLKGIKETCPDVVVMDLILGGVDGFGVLGKPELGSSRIIVTTAMCSDEIVAKCFSMGVSYVLIKPYDFEVLEGRINDILKPVPKNGEVIENVGSIGSEKGVKSITRLLHDVGITPNLKGFRYLRQAVTMVIENEAVIETVTKVIYPGIAKEFKTTPVRAERAIRHAIETSWERDGGETIRRVFNLPDNIKRPTNSEFIGLAAEYLK